MANSSSISLFTLSIYQSIGGGELPIPQPALIPTRDGRNKLTAKGQRSGSLHLGLWMGSCWNERENIWKPASATKSIHRVVPLKKLALPRANSSSLCAIHRRRAPTSVFVSVGPEESCWIAWLIQPSEGHPIVQESVESSPRAMRSRYRVSATPKCCEI